MITEDDIRRMVDLIVEKFRPEKIILFGSYARGEATEDSDVDLIVVLDTEEDLFDKTAEVRLALREVRGGKDVLIRTPGLYKRECDLPWTVFSEADREGRVLYERAS